MNQKTKVKFWVYMREGSEGIWVIAGNGSMWVSSLAEAQAVQSAWQKARPEYTEWRIEKETICTKTEVISNSSTTS